MNNDHDPQKIPLVALVGRSNVGKSALYNRLINKNKSIVEDIAGTTRDLLEQEIKINDKSVNLLDTGGWLKIGDDFFQESIRESLFTVFQEADVIIFVVDGSMSPTNLDYELVDIIRKHCNLDRVILAGNKNDKKQSNYVFNEYSKFGFVNEVTVSAYHAINIHKLIDLIDDIIPDNNSVNTQINEVNMIDLAIVGRPNVGKSSLVNSMLGFERVIVSDIAGTTRDAIDTEFNYEKNIFNLIDTAGIRRRGKIEKGIEWKSALQARTAISRSDVVILLLDLNDPFVSQDSHVASYALEKNKGLILAISKCDVASDSIDLQNVIRIIINKYRFVPWAPIIQTSAVEHKGRKELLDAAIEITRQRSIRIETSELNSFITEAVNKNPPGLVRNRRLKIYYVTQAEINPPNFVFFVNNSENMHFSYKRYLENELRKKYVFYGTSIIMTIKDKALQEELNKNEFELLETD
ncbi:MAG: GTP-binding protein [Chloroflexi bacterium]|nr:MAG: GTP-binding protein [Chloroflexota bacterium]